MEERKQHCCDRERSTHLALQETGIAERLRDGYRCSFLLSSAFFHCCYQNTCTQSSALVVVIELRARACCCFFVCWWLDGAKNASVDADQPRTRSQRIRDSRRWGLAQAERLREGYRYLVPSGAQPPAIEVENFRAFPGINPPDRRIAVNQP